MSAQVTPLFSSPFYQVNLRSELDLQEIDNIFKDVLYSIDGKLSNTGNSFTKEMFFLHKNKNSCLFTAIKKHLDAYFYQILMAEPDIECYITQSWVNISKKNEFHQPHTHPNSFISGSFYYKTDDASGTFRMSSMQYTPLEYRKTTYNIFNSNSWKVIPKQYDLFLFPSSVMHGVERNQSETHRVSLAFNTYLRGNINNGYTTELFLP